MTSLIEPNIHPILVHFSYALSFTAVVAYWISSIPSLDRRKAGLHAAADWMLAFGALAIVATVAAGFQAYYSIAHDGPSHAAMTTHRNWAVPSAIAILALAFWRWKARVQAPSLVFKSFLTLAAISLSVTAWWGGHIVYNYGLGVKSMPEVTGDGHDHDHSPAVKVAEDDNNDGHHDVATPVSGDAASNAVGRDTPEGIVTAYGEALRAGDTQTIKALLLPDVVISEGGGAERSYDEYAGHHLPADMAFTAAVKSTVKKRDVIQGESSATVITASQVHGTFKGKNVHSKMMETMVLKKTEQGWRIAHIHWSSAPITGDHEH